MVVGQPHCDGLDPRARHRHFGLSSGWRDNNMPTDVVFGGLTTTPLLRKLSTPLRKGNAMLFHLYIFFRWIRLTTRRYGFQSLITGRRSKRAGAGRGVRHNPFGRAHGYGVPALYIVRQLQLERAMA